MGINLPCGNKPLTTNECGGDCDEKIERLAERVSEAEEKLDTIQEGAEVNVNADWEETDPNSDAYIENKPSVNYDLSLGDSAPTVGSAVVGSAVLGSLVDIILGRGDGTEDRVSVSGTGAIQITRDGDTMTIHVPVGEIDQLRNGTDTEARAWAANVLKQWLDERIAQIPADQFLDLNKTVFANPFTWSSTTYPGSINPNLDGKPVLVLALTDGENVSYSFLNMEDLIDAYEGVAPISVNGSQISHDNSGVTAGSYGDASNQTPNFGDTFKALRSTVDAKGHVTSMSEHTVKIPDTLATQESAGLMSAEDKEKLDNVDQLYKTTCGNPIVIDDADGEVKSLNVELTPIQAGTPRQDSTVYNEPYLSKDSPSFNSEYDKLVGGTVAWNQLIQVQTVVQNGILATLGSDGIISLSGTSTGTYAPVFRNIQLINGHKGVLLYKVVENPNDVRIRCSCFNAEGTVISNDTGFFYSLTKTKETNVGIADFGAGTDMTGVKLMCIYTDLTQMFGTTVADAIYALEQNEAGSGIAFLKSYDFFTKDYYPYNTGELISVKPTTHVTSETYPLAGVDLRGIFKIADGKLYCDGDTYESDGTVTREYAKRTFDGSEAWGKEADTYNTNGLPVFFLNINTDEWQGEMPSQTDLANMISSKWLNVSYTGTRGSDVGNVFSQADSGRWFEVVQPLGTTLESFKDDLALNPVTVVWEKHTQTTETVTGFTSPQAVGSTESYTDNRDVPIPVGHESRYADIFPIYPHTSLDVRDTGKNLFDKDNIVQVATDAQQAMRYGQTFGAGTYTVKAQAHTSNSYIYAKIKYADGTYSVQNYIATNSVANTQTFTVADGQTLVVYDASVHNETEAKATFTACSIQVEHGTTATSYAPYTGQTVAVPLNDLYGGNVDVIGGESETGWANIPSYNGETISEPWLSSMDEYVQGATPTTGAQVTYKLATPTPLTTTPTALTLYKGDNVVSSDGDMCITYLQDRGDLTDFISDMKDCCEEVKGSLLEHLVDGSVQGSLRGIDTAQEDVNYTLGTDATALGNGTKASGDYSVAEGTQTEASGLHSHAEGVQTKAMQQAAHAEGAATTANALFAHSEGNATNATAMNAHAEGGGTTASGESAHAEGGSTTASAQRAHAEGGGTTASARNAHTEGLGTIANSAEQHVGGSYNEADPTGTATTKGTYVEIIGNGTSNSARSNARTLDWNGNEALQGGLTLGKGTADEVTITAAQLQQLLTLI